MEIERRFLVVPADIPPHDPARNERIDDLYVEDARLRLRRVTYADSRPPLFKLSKKYESPDPVLRPMTTLYLTEAEYDRLSILPGRRLGKQRLRPEGGEPWCVDRFDGPLDGLVIAEIEMDDEAALRALAPPAYAACEVSLEAFYESGNLVRLTAGELAVRLAGDLG